MIKTYDKQAQAEYIQFTNHEVVKTVEYGSHIHVDINSKGIAVGIEILYI